jgi:hypothetical protein
MHFILAVARQLPRAQDGCAGLVVACSVISDGDCKTWPGGNKAMTAILVGTSW